MWTLSGSCPLCLTPPCYHLEPPATAAPFFVPIWVKTAASSWRFQFARQLYREVNHTAVWTERARAPMLTQSYTERVCWFRVSERGRYVRKVVERDSAGVVRRAARRFAGLLRLVS